MSGIAALAKFKKLCVTNDLIKDAANPNGDDIRSGIVDDGTLFRFLRARNYDVEKAFQQYQATRKWRDENQLIELYETIDVSKYEETRKLYTHWTGRRDRNGVPLFLFEIGQLSPSLMAAYKASCSSTTDTVTGTESQAMLRLFCTYENLIRFVFPLCSTVQSRPNPGIPITQATCIVDISGVGLLQFWRLKTHMQAASSLATAHYPETLGRTYIIGAPSFFPTVWSWINKWFDQNTVSKIFIVPPGQEYSMLSELIDPINIPHRYGGQFDFDFGMVPDLDSEIMERMKWLKDENGQVFEELPLGPMRWIEQQDGTRTAIAVGTVNQAQRKMDIMALGN
ncbi:hypothetical protein PFICI_09589 [Pestalotiopsis fici W106-1]|uniref:CRAL-TRIO domain-containing protein n=1 Tax=Pestalotiopsis fici (strain W106-1 / CGMCC3.15140) TaxID=1229662 RepID=W3X3M4_PESFW|nr:uncharacterized protein PFICI_09589 [Pestalotiopsis fici W106-1]ETS79736.1 hypothetical protein PFICI_09589 [Pestalotiopsis fici W106-1]